MRLPAFGLLLGLLMRPLLATCGEGCVSCSVDKDNVFSCAICDRYNGFFQKVGSTECGRLVLDNCEIPSPDFLCYICLPGYVQDSVAGKCLKVPPGSAVENCHRYNQAAVCQVCVSGFFISNTVCEAVTTTIAQCSAYSTATQCSECNDGFFLVSNTTVTGSSSVTTTSCQAIVSKDNCQAYSLAQCDACLDNKTINRNYMNSAPFSKPFIQSTIVKNIKTIQFEPKEGPICVDGAETFCAKVDPSTGTCQTCLNGYYLSGEGLCVKNPEEAVANCQYYNSPNNCRQCKSEFYLQNSICRPQTRVENCIKYSPSVDQCIECNSEHYLNINSCARRNNIIIPQCKRLRANEDTCDECLPGYYLYGSRLGCQAKIPNCQTEAENSTDNTKPRFTCTTCEDNFYPSDDKLTCFKQFIANCDSYVANSNACTTCSTGHYYDSTSKSCLSDYVPNCTTPDATNRGKCSVCQSGFYKDSNGACHPYTVTNCTDKKADADECNACDTGASSAKIFYLSMSDKRCRPYTLSGCTTPNANSDTCDTCDTANGFVKDANNRCRRNPSPGCANFNWTTKQCEGCTNQGTDYYLDAGTKTCQRYSIEGCSDKSMTSNRCGNNCLSGYYHNPITSLCLRYDLIGCKVSGRNASSNECTDSGCETGYYFDLTSKLCHRYSIDESACQTPMANQDGCTACKAGYYKDAASNNCFKVTLPGCQTVNPTNPKLCTTCDGDFITSTSPPGVCLPRTAMNCVQTATNSDVCSSCNYSAGYAMDADSKNCVKRNIIGCKVFNNITGICTSCLSGLVLVGSNSCQVPSKPHCIHYDTSNGNCTHCQQGFYLNLGSCPENTAANCAVKKTDSNQCQICKQGYFSNSGTCAAVTKKNCFTTSLTIDACETCLPGFTFSANECVGAVLYEGTSYGCLYNNGSTKNCSKCKSGFFKYDREFTQTRLQGCVKYSGSECTQCDRDYSLNTGKTCDKSKSNITPCVQKRDSQTSELSDNNNCHRCRDQTTHFINSANTFACEPFTALNQTPFCAQLRTDADGCELCSEEYPPLTSINISVCLKKSIPVQPNLTNVGNCAVIKFAQYLAGTYTCQTCKRGHYFDTSTPPKCVLPSSALQDVGIDFTAKWVPETQALVTSGGVNNCVKYMRGSSTGFVCVQCANGHVAQLGLESYAESRTKINTSFWDDTNEEILNKASSANFTDCQPHTAITNPPNNPIVIPANPFENCATFITISAPFEGITDPTSFCTKCKPGFKGKVLLSGNDSGGNSTTDIYTSLFLHCDAETSEMVKRFSYFNPGLPGPTPTNNVIFNVNMFFPYDSCTEGKHFLVFLHRTASTGGIAYVNIGGSASYNMMCMDTLATTHVANCQIHRIIPISNTAIDLSTQSWGCEACKPGFKMGGNIHDVITTCTPIENCDLSDSVQNTWMNNCQTCKKGFSWPVGSNKIIQYEQCASNLGEVQCRVWDSEDSRCMVCHTGFDLVNYKCVPQKVDDNCLEYSMPIISFRYDNTATERSYNLGFFLKLLEDKPPIVGCGSCKPGFDTVFFPDNAKTCARTSFNLDRISNCSLYNFKDLLAQNISDLQCSSCEKGYALLSNKKSCLKTHVDSSNHGCASLSSSGACLTCHEGFSFYTGKSACIDNQYLDMDLTSESYSQIVFKPGFRLFQDKTIVFGVVPISDNNPCSQYSNTECIRCKDDRKVPLKLESFLAEGINLFECIYFDNAQHAFPGFLSHPAGNFSSVSLKKSLSYFGDYTFSKTISTHNSFCASHNASDSTCVLQYSTFYCAKCITGYFQPDLRKSVSCQPIPVPNCAEYDPKLSKCFKCLKDFFLTSTFACQKRTVLDCMEFSEVSDSCVSCRGGYFIQADGNNKPKCQKYSKKNCAEFHKSGDFCYKCLEGYYFDSTSGDCKFFQQTGCMDMARTKDRCLQCKDGFFLAGSGVCYRSTVSNCQRPNKYSNTCLVCEIGSFLDENSLCQFHSASNCKAYHPYLNQCTECHPNTYLKDGQCRGYTALNCRTFSPVADACLSCFDRSFFSDTGGSCRSYSVKHCQQVSRSSDSCLTCEAGTFKDRHTCSQYSVENCSIYDRFSDGCSHCLENFYLDDDKRCKAYTLKNCDVFFSHSNRCKICQEGNYRDSSFRCHPYDINRCLRFHANENKCLACQGGFYLQSGRCRAYSVRFCREFHPFQNQCLVCNSGFFFTESGTCQSYTLQNCDRLDPSRNGCLKCADKFFMKPDATCEPYSVSCKTYNPYADECLSCEDKYHLVLGKSCRKNDLPNCLKFVADKNQCSECEKGYLLKDAICSKFTARNCQSFRADADQCETCLPEKFFKSGNNCLPSTVIRNCQTYKPDQDACDQCRAGHYLSANVCKPNPEGIPNCTHYIDRKTCRRCESGMFLKENVCTTSSVLIPNCLNYIDNGVCGECQPNFILGLSNNCASPSNATCLTFVDALNCSTCDRNQILRTNAQGNVDCVDSGIQNCAQAVVTNNVNTCERCMANFVLTNNTCVTPQTLIQGCLHYRSQTECLECSTNFILAVDQRSCLQNDNRLDSSCRTGHFNSTPQCFLCKPGYKFDPNGNCVKCGGEGCDNCTVKGDGCRICKKGFFMNTLFQCLQYSPSFLRVIEDDGTLASHFNSASAYPSIALLSALISLSLWLRA